MGASFMNFMFFLATRQLYFSCVVKQYVLIFWQNKVMMMSSYNICCIPRFCSTSNSHSLHTVLVQVLEKLMDCRLPSTLAALYGPHLTCRLAVAHARLIIRIAESILLLPNYTNLPVSVADA